MTTNLPPVANLAIDVWGTDLDENKKARAEASANAKGLEPCTRCGRGVIEGKGWWIEVTDGGAGVVLSGAKADKDDPGYVGYFLLGSECARLVPVEYRTKQS